MQSFADFPSWMATAWGISEITAQVILSGAVFLAVVLPIVFMRGDRSSFNVEIIGGFFALVICVGLGWLHYWILITVIVIVGIAAAVLGVGKIFGGD